MDVSRHASRLRTAAFHPPVPQKTCEAVARSRVMVRPIDKGARLARRRVTERLVRFFQELRGSLESNAEFSQKVMERAETLQMSAKASRPRRGKVPSRL
jgi:hypothetical protein